jgi:hypothetical protein
VGEADVEEIEGGFELVGLLGSDETLERGAAVVGGGEEGERAVGTE